MVTNRFLGMPRAEAFGKPDDGSPWAALPVARWLGLLVLALWMIGADAADETDDREEKSAPSEMWKSERDPTARCSYDFYKWNAQRMKAVARVRVEKPFSALTSEEVDPKTGCSVCQEDQVELRLTGVPPFRVCRHMAAKVEATLKDVQSKGVQINRVEAYRVGMTRGTLDSEGNRTRFSNHSYGIALDINPADNGLYESCSDIGPGCRLRKGGRWDPAGNPRSLTPNHAVVAAMKSMGMKWGGELAGQQKDFMHFSPTGD